MEIQKKSFMEKNIETLCFSSVFEEANNSSIRFFLVQQTAIASFGLSKTASLGDL